MPELNHPAFHAAEAYLKRQGFRVVNPATFFPQGEPQRQWHFYMKKLLPLLVDCDFIYMLSGWSNSRGAKLEWHLAHELDIPVLYEQTIGEKKDGTS